MALVFFIFFAVNTVVYFGMLNIQSLFAVIERIGQVLVMDEHQKRRIDDTFDQPLVSLDNASFSWGFKKVQTNVEDKKDPTLKVEVTTEPIIHNLDLEL